MSTNIQNTTRAIDIAIDVAGDRYFLGKQKPVNLGFKSRAEYIAAFGNNPKTERLLSTYFRFGYTISADSIEEDDKADIIKILERRLPALKESTEYSSSILKNTMVQRYYINTQKLINELKGFAPAPINEELVALEKEVKSIDEEHQFQLILEMAWYLLHPEGLPRTLRKEWLKMVKNLNTLRLGDIVNQVKTEAELQKIDIDEPALNYFKRIELSKVLKENEKKSALDEARRMILEVKQEQIEGALGKRLQSLLTILQTHKYINNGVNIKKIMRNVNSNAYNTMEKGIDSSLVRKLGVSMKPIYDYYSVLYDPIYSFIDANIQEYVKSNLLPIENIIRLIFVAGQISNAIPSKYGIYRIKNCSPNVKIFVNFMIEAVKNKLTTMDYAAKENFTLLVNKLPQISLSTVVAGIRLGKGKKRSDYLQFITKSSFKSLPLKEDLLDISDGAGARVAKSHRIGESDPLLQGMNIDNLVDELNNFFTDDIFILYTERRGDVIEQIPMHVYDVDMSTIDDVTSDITIDIMPDNYFNITKIKGLPFYLSDIVNIDIDAGLNSPEMVMSVLIGLKELIPK